MSLGRCCKAFYEASVSLTSSLKLQDVLEDLVRTNWEKLTREVLELLGRDVV